MLCIACKQAKAAAVDVKLSDLLQMGEESRLLISKLWAY
jgi:hypothetical protein